MRALVLIASLCLATASEAQRPARAGSPERATAPTTVRAGDWQEPGGVPVVRLRHERGAGMATGRRTFEPLRVQRDVELTDRQRGRLLQGAEGPATGSGQVGARPKPVLQHLRLSPQQPTHAFGELRIGGIVNIDFAEDAAKVYSYHVGSRPQYQPGIDVRMRVEEGARYLIDFHVDPRHRMTFELEGAGISMEYEMEASDEHILLIVEPEGSWWTTLRLRPQAANNYASSFHFYGVEVSRLD